MNKMYISYEDIHTYCDQLVIKLEKYKFDYIVAVSRGGLLPGVYMSHKMNLPLYPIVWSTRDHTQQISYCDIAEDLANGKTILLVDEINDTGKTFIDLLQDWDYDKQYGTLIIATLFQRFSTRFPSHYSIVKIENNDDWVVTPWEI